MVELDSTQFLGDPTSVQDHPTSTSVSEDHARRMCWCSNRYSKDWVGAHRKASLW